MTAPASDATMIGRIEMDGPLDFPTYRLLQRLRFIPSHGLPMERRGPVTLGALIDARATIQEIVAADEDNSAPLNSGPYPAHQRQCDSLMLQHVIGILERLAESK